jgi:8-oxo-dGTP pyrophosphatase MutT (NUDIX family)
VRSPSPEVVATAASHREPRLVREAHEEIGLPPLATTLLGTLGSVSTLSSGSLVLPVVGAVEHDLTSLRTSDEVERVFVASLA